MAKSRDKIIDAAISLFSENAYEQVSVAKICKVGKVSNGIFYRHFKDKEEIFKYLLDETSNRIAEYLSKTKGETILERLENFIRINFELTKYELPLIKVYREGQYKFTFYEKKLRNVYLDYLEVVFNRRLDEYEYLFIMSGIRYINVNYHLRNLKNDPAFLAQILYSGFLDKSSIKISDLKTLDIYLRVPFNSENLKHQLQLAGEKLFGTQGIYDTKIFDIAASLGKGVGSFYYYYKTKEEFLKEIGIKIKNTLLYFLKDNSENNLNFNANDRNLLYLYLMLEYYQNDTYKYQIMRELEFIEPSIYREYYNNLEEFYISSLENSNYTFKEKQIISNVLLGIAHYMGIDFFFIKLLNNKDEFLEKMEYYFVNGLKN